MNSEKSGIYLPFSMQVHFLELSKKTCTSKSINAVHVQWLLTCRTVTNVYNSNHHIHTRTIKCFVLIDPHMLVFVNTVFDQTKNNSFFTSQRSHSLTAFGCRFLIFSALNVVLFIVKYASKRK